MARNVVDRGNDALNRPFRRARFWVFACLSFVFGNVALAATYFVWIDEDGNTRVSSAQPAIGVKFTTVEGPDPVRWFNAPTPPNEVAEDDKAASADAARRAAESVYVLYALPPAGANPAGRALGSAVAITDHLLLTACHVIARAGDQIYVGGGDDAGAQQATIEGAAYELDRCVIRVARMQLRPVAGLRKYDSIEVGEKVVAIGNPRGLKRSITNGLVSGKRVTAGGRYLQTNAAISPGSSGGGLFDEKGNLLGITTFALKDSQGLNFAIPAEDFWP